MLGKDTLFNVARDGGARYAYRMFVCTLTSGVPVHADILEAEGEFVIRIPVGYLDGTNLVYSAFVALSPLAGHPPGSYELAFTIIEARTDETHFEEFWDGLATKDIFDSAEDRCLILSVVTGAVVPLIDAANPTTVHITTHSAYLPVNALAKYEGVLDVLRAQGFQIEQAQPYHGRRMWMCTR